MSGYEMYTHELPDNRYQQVQKYLVAALFPIPENGVCYWYVLFGVCYSTKTKQTNKQTKESQITVEKFE